MFPRLASEALRLSNSTGTPFKAASLAYRPATKRSASCSKPEITEVMSVSAAASLFTMLLPSSALGSQDSGGALLSCGYLLHSLVAVVCVSQLLATLPAVFCPPAAVTPSSPIWLA